MKRSEFEHVVKAAADVVKDDIVVIGSQAIYGQFDEVPSAVVRSLEADVYPRKAPERADEIDGAIGEGSQFYETYGYYAHGVGPETAKAPAGWEARLVELDLPSIRPREGRIKAWCLEAHDLVLAKLVAGRPHDIEFAIDAIGETLVDAGRLLRGLELMQSRDEARARANLEIVMARLRAP